MADIKKEVEVFSYVCDNEESLIDNNKIVSKLRIKTTNAYEEKCRYINIKYGSIALISGILLGSIFMGIHSFRTLANAIDALLSFIAATALGTSVMSLLLSQKYTKEKDNAYKEYEEENTKLNKIEENNKGIIRNNQRIIDEVRKENINLEEINLLTVGSIEELCQFYNVDSLDKVAVDYLLMLVKCYNSSLEENSQLFYGNYLKELYNNNHSMKKVLKRN